jgi:hypothetical protein
MSDYEKLPANMSFSYQHLFYPVGNLRGGYSWAPLAPTAMPATLLTLPQLEVRNDISKMDKPRKRRTAGTKKY